MNTRLKAKPPAQHEPTKPKMLIFGPAGVGKTWFSLDFPACFYIDTEGGAARTHYMSKLEKSGGMVLGTEEGALDFETVIGQFQALATEKHSFKTVVIDSISKLYNSAIATEAERLGDKDAFGASKKPAIAYMRRLVNWINRVDMNVVLVAHDKEQWGQDAKGDRVNIGTTFDCWDKLAFELDLVLAASIQGSSRYASVRKSRLLGFPDRERFELSFPVFAERYGKDVIEKKVEAIHLITPEQLEELNRLVGIFRPSEEDIQKILTKANAASWAELTTDQADKLIKFYIAKINKTKE